MNLWAVVEYITKYAMKNPAGSKRVGEIVQDAMEEVSKHTKEATGVDFLKESVKKFYAKTWVGGRMASSRPSVLAWACLWCYR